MTNDKEKEELRKKFEKLFELDDLDYDIIFDFFYSEIEAREKEMKGDAFRDWKLAEERDEMRLAKLKSQEAIIQAADEVIEKSKNLCTYTTYPRHKESYKQALEKYNNLKTKI